MDGNTALGASSPAKPAFTRPEPLSHTRAVVSSSSHMAFGFCKDRKAVETHSASAQEAPLVPDLGTPRGPEPPLRTGERGGDGPQLRSRAQNCAAPGRGAQGL